MKKIIIHTETGEIEAEVEFRPEFIIYKGEVYRYDNRIDYVWAGSSITVK